jgi:hypothetical protein
MCVNVLDDLWRNDLARPAPRREAVEHHEGVLGRHRLVELRLVLQVVHAFFAHGCGEVSDALRRCWLIERCDVGSRS